MTLVRAKTWLRRHPRWRSLQTASKGITRIPDLDRLNEQYLMLIQANAMQWCIGKTDAEIKHRARGLML